MSTKKKTQYQITIGYKAVITVDINANDEAEAKKLALAEFTDKFCRGGSNKINIQSDNYKVDGIINMDETWNILG
jgi:hypothetical protein